MNFFRPLIPPSVIPFNDGVAAVCLKKGQGGTKAGTSNRAEAGMPTLPGAHTKV